MFHAHTYPGNNTNNVSAVHYLLFYKDMTTVDCIKSGIEIIIELLPNVQNQVFPNKVYGI